MYNFIHVRKDWPAKTKAMIHHLIGLPLKYAKFSAKDPPKILQKYISATCNSRLSNKFSISKKLCQ